KGLFGFTADGFPVAVVALRRLRTGLPAVGVSVCGQPGGCGFWGGEIRVTQGTFISLPAVFTAVLHRAVLMAKRTLFINIGKKPPKGLYDKVSGGFYHS
ncbi:hypothetical protein, partial [Neisseria iguanae]